MVVINFIFHHIEMCSRSAKYWYNEKVWQLVRLKRFKEHTSFKILIFAAKYRPIFPSLSESHGLDYDTVYMGSST